MSKINIDKFLKKLYNDENNKPASKIELPNPIEMPSPGLNWALNGGIYPGGFYCFEGPEQSGKSFMALCCVAEMLKKDPEAVVIWFDTERSFNRGRLAIVLPDPQDQERVIVRQNESKPYTGSLIFDYFNDTIVGMMQEGLKVAACVVDSLQMIVPPKESELKSTEDHVMGDLSGYLPKALRLITAPSKPRLKENYNGVAWIFISQVRDNLSPTAMYSGKKYSISGGRAFKHALDTEVLFEIIESNKAKILDENIKNMNDSLIQVGHRVRAKVMKNRLGPPARVVEFDIHYDKGIINQPEEIATLGIKLGYLKKDGNTYYYKDQKIGIGEEKTIEAISKNISLQNEIVNSIMQKDSHEPFIGG